MTPREAIVLRDAKRGQRFMFPVNPPSIQVSDGREFNEVPIIGLGVALTAGPMQPQELQFESFFPRDYDASFCNYIALERPEDSIERIQFWMGRSRVNKQVAPTPLRVSVTGTQFTQLMVVTTFEHTYQGGEPDAVYFQIALRQWRRQRIRIEDEDTSGSGSSGSGGGNEGGEVPLAGQTYVVVSGDTLTKIAKRFYGDGSKWPTIYEANKAVIGLNPNLILPGQVLVIP